jgi:hypothetical protein
MITTTVRVTVTGSGYGDLLEKSKAILSEFFEIEATEVESKIKFELLITENSDALDFQEENYVAEIIAKVRDV